MFDVASAIFDPGGPRGAVLFYFKGAESISGLGSAQFLGFGPGLGTKTWRLDSNLGQNPAWEGPGRVKHPGPFSVRKTEFGHVWSFGPQTFVI